MIPGDLIELGLVAGAYGLRGWVRVSPFAADGSVLQSVRSWWLIGGSEPRQLAVQDVKRHAQSIIAKWKECDSKEDADALKGAKVAVARSQFPPARDGEHYLNDVIGHRVINRQGVELGTVSGLRSGNSRDRDGVATQWLEVKGSVGHGSNKKRPDRRAPLLIPLVEQYVDAIEADSIRVDWEANW
ncbi:MAG: ribosome maturation factor RimM [Burkholderiaceae bacterium]